MAPDTGDLDVEVRPRGGYRAGHGTEAAYRHARGVVHPEQPVAGKLLEQAVLDHGAGTADPLLGGLEDEDHLAAEVPRCREVFGCAEQHHGMSVVAAGVHAAFVVRAVRERVRLRDGQGIHIRPQADGTGLVALPQHAHDTGLAYATMHLDAERPQFLRHEVGGAPLLETEFRMRVDVAAPTRQRVVPRHDVFNERHVSSSDRSRSGFA